MVNNTYTPARAIGHVLFISAPAILIAAFMAQWIRELLHEWRVIEITDSVFWVFLFFVMFVAMWLSSYKLLAAIFGVGEKDDTPGA